MTDQSEIVQALETGAIKGGLGPARRVDTHLSHVFLTGDRAIKLKRAVKLPFVDFRSLEARLKTLQAELALNRRTAPSLYLDILPITREGGALALGGEGEPIDYVLLMRRFADEALFDAMAQDGRLTRELIEETAERIADFHRGLAPAKEPVGAAYYQSIIRELKETEAHGAKTHGFSRASEDLFAALFAALSRIGPLIDVRAASGHVRRGQGDLHLRNICLYDGKPTLFDALEFDEALATTDTLYDFAFLLMDLHHRGLTGHANAAMNRYWDASGEEEDGLCTLPFFMALRACVRMSVAVEAGKADEADQYAALAMDLLRPSKVRLVAIGGLSGTGKSALAARLAALFPGACGARLLRSDVVRKRLAGKAEAERLGEGAYGEEQRMAVYRALSERAGAALGCASVIADATFREDQTRQWIAQAASGKPFAGLWLTAPKEVRLARVGGRTGDASDADVRIAAAQREPQEVGAGWTKVDASDELGGVIARAGAALGLNGD